MGVKSPKLSPDHNLGQLSIFECLFIVLKGMMLVPLWNPSPTLFLFLTSSKKSLSFGKPFFLILVLLVSIALCIISVKALRYCPVIIDFCVIVLSGQYILLHFACLPNPEHTT